MTGREQLPGPAASSTATWLSERPDGVSIHVRVQPRAGREAVAGVRGDALKVRVCGAPVEGKANDELLRFLAKLLSVPPSALSVLRGEHSREKILLARGLKAPDVIQRLTR